MKDLTITLYVSNLGADHSYKDYLLNVGPNGISVDCSNTEAQNTPQSFTPSVADMKIINAIKGALLEMGFYKEEEKHVA